MKKPKPLPAICLALASAREAAGLTQAALAAKLGTTVTTISRYERGKTDPPASVVERIAAACGRKVELTK